MIAFYPIKPVYSERILTGEKTYELRKRLPKLNVKYVLIYSTTPVARVVGYAKVKAFHKAPINELWTLVNEQAGICFQDYQEYFANNKDACAIELYEVRKFARPFIVSDIRDGFSVPQSYCYVDTKTFNRLKRRKSEAVCLNTA